MAHAARTSIPCFSVKLRALWGTLPAAWPQTAPASELAAMMVAAEAMDVKEDTRILADCRSVIDVMAGAPQQQLRAARPWAGAYRAAHAIAQSKSPLAAVEKVPAHTVEVEGEDPPTRLRRLGNDWADSQAKLAVQLHPQPLPSDEKTRRLVWKHAHVACRVLAEATLMWPAAVPAVPREVRPTTRGARRQQADDTRRRRGEQAGHRRATRAAQQQDADSSHEWVPCGSISRCAKCQIRRAASGLERCPGVPHELERWAAQAREHGHVLAMAAYVPLEGA